MKFNVEISLSQYELDFLVDYDWFKYYTPQYKIIEEDKLILKSIINKNIIILNYEYNEYFYTLTQLGEKIFEQYK